MNYDEVYNALSKSLWREQTFNNQLLNIIGHMFIYAVEHGYDMERFQQEYKEAYNLYMKNFL